jgi:septum formation protein
MPRLPSVVLASTSPQRSAILEQLGIPFEVIPPRYEEHDLPGVSPAAAARAHAEGKARSVLGEAAGRPVLGVDTAVVAAGRVYGKPSDEPGAREMLAALAGREHEVISGLCLIGPNVELLEHDTTRVEFRPLTARQIDDYLSTGEWEGRAGAYAIQGRGAWLVSRIEGDYLNVVGLPAALLVGLLAEHFPGVYGCGSPGAAPPSATPYT